MRLRWVLAVTAGVLLMGACMVQALQSGGAGAVSSAQAEVMPANVPAAKDAVAVYSARLKPALAAAGFEYGSPLLVRILKRPGVLEVWLQKQGRFQLFKTYRICYFSGSLGPKQRDGDGQSPEGFYDVKPGQMNPNSKYYLAFNLGYPNAYDRAHQRTGSALMVHGNCVSIGCYAMTDARIGEIYTLAQAAFEHGQKSFQVQAFPFALTDAQLNKHRQSPWYEFWRDLKIGADYFDRHHIAPRVVVKDGRYTFSAPN